MARWQLRRKSKDLLRVKLKGIQMEWTFELVELWKVLSVSMTLLSDYLNLETFVAESKINKIKGQQQW